VELSLEDRLFAHRSRWTFTAADALSCRGQQFLKTTAHSRGQKTESIYICAL
jgi:hypothetical protein